MKLPLCRTGNTVLSKHNIIIVLDHLIPLLMLHVASRIKLFTHTCLSDAPHNQSLSADEQDPHLTSAKSMACLLAAWC